MSVQDEPMPLLDLSQEQKFQAALALFLDQAQVIRDLKQNDLQVVGGFITLQLALAAWLAEHPPMTFWGSLGLFGLSIILSFLSWKFLEKNHRRRAQVVDSLRNTKAALRLSQKEIYIKGAALDVQTMFEPSLRLYVGVLLLTILGVGVVIFGGQF